MKNNIAKVGSAFKTQTSENMTDANDVSQQTRNTKNILERLTPSELFWYERLAALQPLQLPFETAGEQTEPRWTMSAWQSPLPKNGEEEPLRTLLQTFVIYLARLTQQTSFQIGWRVDEVKDESANLATVVPMAVEVALDKPWREVAGWVDDELSRLARHGTFSCDLFSCSPSLQAIPALATSRPWRIAVSLIKDDRPRDKKVSGELLTFQINEQGGFRWIYDENRLSTEVVLRMSEHLQVLAASNRMGDEIPSGSLICCLRLNVHYCWKLGTRLKSLILTRYVFISYLSNRQNKLQRPRR